MIKYGFKFPTEDWIQFGGCNMGWIRLSGQACTNQANVFQQIVKDLWQANYVNDRGVCSGGTVVRYGISRVAFRGIGKGYFLVQDTNIIGVFDYCKYLYGIFFHHLS